jgi:hypothetical protein
MNVARGGIIAGWASQYIGRRFTIMYACNLFPLGRILKCFHNLSLCVLSVGGEAFRNSIDQLATLTTYFSV